MVKDRPYKEKLQVCNGGLAKKNYQYGVVCALRVRKSDILILEEEISHIPDTDDGVEAN